MAPLTRRQLAQAAAVNAETIRFYERQGVLPPPPRSPRGHRQYSPEAVERLAVVRGLRQYGFPLAEIRLLLVHPLPEISQRLRAMDALRKELAALAASLS